MEYVTYAQEYLSCDDICRVVIHLPSATLNSPVYEILFLTIFYTGIHLTSL